MRSLLIALDGSLYMTMLPYHMRHRQYLMSTQQPTTVEFGVWFDKPVRMKLRIFEWRGQIVRRDATEVVDFFEEIES